MTQDQDALKLLGQIVNQAVAEHASDLYFLPKRTQYHIILRTVTSQQVVAQVSLAAGMRMINYLKFKAQMSLSEHRRPQLGAFMQDQHQLDFTSTELAPTTLKQPLYLRLAAVGDFLAHEALVVRLIYPLSQIKGNFAVPSQWQALKQACLRRGLILFAGPMGSGKTSSMYQLAQQFLPQQILCLEDPIEIYAPEFLQLQVNEQAKMSYAELLKVALRLHPDVMIVGEIRDAATAKIVVNAALSGHLIFSTVHATNVYGVLQRLRNLGISEAELRQTVSFVTYQRILPTAKGPQVLFDQLDVVEHAWQNLTKHHTMTAKWRDHLEQLTQKNVITAACQAQFENG